MRPVYTLAKAELAEAWADAFEARWGQERAAAAGVRDAVLREIRGQAYVQVERCDEMQMKLVACEARIGQKQSVALLEQMQRAREPARDRVVSRVPRDGAR